MCLFEISLYINGQVQREKEQFQTSRHETLEMKYALSTTTICS
jgi:hypothetical protein